MKDTPTTKQTYERPALQAWGTVADLTSVGSAGGGGDIFSGSVNEGGCATNNLGPQFSNSCADFRD